ncbi:LysM peptidoglycan-binding domain-containing protein [Persicobacter diffluens]|uniref:LysM domain-containing protein n=1 Tax=Persicobacter diffluens TaxID=981 RepID=A0AAN5AIP5_9BACT|nr:hypothetical protein PEDI_06510 [Persicobacter diffluens]
MTCKKIALALTALLFSWTVGNTDVVAQSHAYHTIEKGQTLYSISRKYKTTVAKLEEMNPGLSENLGVGQKIKVPAAAGAVGEKATKSKSGSEIVHVVQSKETLYSISKKYSVSANQLMQYNGMSNTSLSLGQKIKIPTDGTDAVKFANHIADASNQKHQVAKGETLYAISSKYKVSVDNIKKWNGLSSNSLKEGQYLIVGLGTGKPEQETEVVKTLPATTKPKPVKEVTAKADNPEVKEIAYSREEIEDGTDFKKIRERGMSGIMTGSEDTKKYLALHPSAPVGTIMQVRNDMNNYSVFVRVIGKLPPTGDNANLVIALSKTAYERLGAFDQRFPVEVTYVP